MTQESPHESAAEEPVDPSSLSPTLVNLLQTDPLSLTPPDLTFLVRYYRMKRLEFDSLAKKPRTLKSSRGPALSKEETKAKLDSLLGSLIGQTPKDQGNLDEIEEEEEGDEEA